MKPMTMLAETAAAIHAPRPLDASAAASAMPSPAAADQKRTANSSHPKAFRASAWSHQVPMARPA